MEPCEECNGKGGYYGYSNTDDGHPEKWCECEFCNGSGELIEEEDE